MTISAKVIADSINPDGVRITTLQARYPKFIHGEFLTHRAFSRNSSSSNPTEHQAQAIDVSIRSNWPKKEQMSNFHPSWLQYRKTIEA